MSDAFLDSVECSLRLDREAFQTVQTALSCDQTFRFNVRTLGKALSQAQPPLLFCGVGKSGYIAKKAVSSFSSLQIPAFFLHPAEAVHGELGAITEKSFLLFFSKSGKSEELYPILDYAQKKNLNTALITADPQSPLARECRFSVALPPFKEAGIFGYTPHTVSLLFLALTEALASAIAQERHFSEKTFKTLHPAGMLGKNLLSLSEITAKAAPSPPLLVSPETSLMDILFQISFRACDSLGVCASDGTLIGQIRQKEINAFSEKTLKNFKALKARDIMVPVALTLREDMMLSEALAVLKENSFSDKSVFVLNNNKVPTGLLAVSDLGFCEDES